MKQRLLSTLVIAAALLGMAFTAPVIAVWPILVAIAVLAQLEFYRLLDAAGIPAFRIVGCIAGGILLSLTFLALTAPQFFRWMPDACASEMEVMVLFLLVFVICLRQFPQKSNPQPLNTIACTIFGVLYVPFLMTYFAKILLTPYWSQAGILEKFDVRASVLFFYFVFVVKCCDSGALFIGKRWGRHKMIPRISPGKTWEGLVGGLLGGIVSSIVFYYVFRSPAPGGDWLLGRVPFGMRDVLILGGVLSGVGVLGDLVESLLKRAANTKDSGGLVPGLGGLLDVLDSLLLAAPVLYYYVRIFLTTAERGAI